MSKTGIINSLKGILSDEWIESLSGYLNTDKFNNIISTIRNEKQRGFKIQPSTDRTFRALNLVKPNDVKVIMCAQDPYNSLWWDGSNIADGLAFSCGLTKSPQPSLRNIHKGIKQTLGSSTMEETDWDLEYLSRQGVLLINSSLTVRSNYPNSHKGLWDSFLDEVFFGVVNKLERPVVYILLGKEAQNSFLKYVRIGDHVLTAVHPAAASYTGGVWECNDIFRKCNKYLEQEGLEPIKW